jgi:hypothetical protein
MKRLRMAAPFSVRPARYICGMTCCAATGLTRTLPFSRQLHRTTKGRAGNRLTAQAEARCPARAALTGLVCQRQFFARRRGIAARPGLPAADPRFGRRGADLWMTVPLDIPDAVLGTTLKIPTLGGHVDVKVPAGPQADEILRLRGKGLVKYGGYGRGDMHVRLLLQVPEHLSKEEKELYTRLREAGDGRSAKKRWRQ